jgi:peroxiredoxin
MTTIVLLVLIFVSLCIGFYELVKQQGRILLRLDQLGQATTAAGPKPEELDAENEPHGLAIKTPFPAFNFPDVMGRMVALESFRGKNVLLLHWNFECGFCESLAPELSHLEGSLERQNVQLVLLAYGEAQSNREQATEHGLKCPILLIEDNQTPQPFERLGTPATYLLDEEGRVVAPSTAGADQVLCLASEVASAGMSSFTAGKHTPQRNRIPGERPLAESRIERNGLKAGTPAPLFQLPDLQGHVVSLAEYRGRRVLLVFSDPQCGPCDELAPDLARLHREHANNGMAFILVGRGNATENRRKTEQHKLQFPVVLQEKWELSKEYGIFATPVAFLIEEDGVIARDVAVGADAVLALAVDGLGTGRGAK